MKHLHAVLILIFGAVLGVSCDLSTELELELPVVKRKLVANCLFSADSAWTATVFSSEHPLIAQEYQGHLVTNATIRISDGINVVNFEIDSTRRPCFRSTEGKAKTGETYTLEVSAPGYETIRSSVTVPGPVSITGASSYKLPPSENAEYYERRIKISFADPPDEKNFYAVVVNAETYSPYSELAHIKALPVRPTDETINERFISALFSQYKGNQIAPLFFDDRFFNGYEQNLELSWEESVRYDLPPDVLFHISLWSVSEAYYNYRLTVQKQKD